MNHRGRPRGMIPLLALHTFAEYYRHPRKPPVTAGLLVANTLIYLRPGGLDAILPPIDQVWFNPHLILKYKDYKRFFLSALYHVGEPHLVYNMLSLLWKGTQLENMMGSAEFASMIAALLVLSQGITLLLSKSLLTLFDYDKPYYREYSVGFSGILFAMKVVLNSYSDDLTSVYGVLVPSRYAAWAELILIQMFVPGVSFLGHLSGILAGILYLGFKRSFYSGSNPLALMFRGISSALTWPLRFLKGISRNRQDRRRFVGRRNEAGMWRCQACTYDNTDWLRICEMCGNGRESEAPSSPPRRQYSQQTSQDHLSLEELRHRRLERFGR